MSRHVLLAARLVTCDPARAIDANPLGAIDDAALVVDGETIAWVGPRAELPPPDAAAAASGDAAALSPLVTPGLVDAHTHAAWVGSRHAEYAIRMAGGDYRAIAAAGGGIVASHAAIAAASEDAIAGELAARLARM